MRTEDGERRIRMKSSTTFEKVESRFEFDRAGEEHEVLTSWEF
jgi:hypothetical protein